LGHFTLCNLFWINIPKKNKKPGKMIGYQLSNRAINAIVKAIIGRKEKRMKKNSRRNFLIFASP